MWNVPFSHITCSREGRFGVPVLSCIAARVWRQVTAMASDSTRIREPLETMITVQVGQ